MSSLRTPCSTTRLAPSPTGALHLGNARTFLVNHLLAVQRGWRMLLRIEDLDGPRTKPGAAEQALEDLAWLGLTWDSEVVYQSARTGAYEAALRRLIDAGEAYPCTCSRRDIELAGGAPHADDHTRVYPGTCRDQWESPRQAQRATGRPVAWRVRVPEEPILVEDAFMGARAIHLPAVCGDFVIYRNEGLAGYQLAVVVDDAAAGVDAIVRGDDLLDSAARQMLLYRLLGLSPLPRYWHLPLVIGEDGRRLAKRHGDTRISRYRQSGTPPERMLGLLGCWCGLLDEPREADMAELVRRFDLARMPTRPVVFGRTDHLFLTG